LGNEQWLLDGYIYITLQRKLYFLAWPGTSRCPRGSPVLFLSGKGKKKELKQKVQIFKNGNVRNVIIEYWTHNNGIGNL